jgi:hypothetical protein
MTWRVVVFVIVVRVLAYPQVFSQRGFVNVSTTGYPQTTPNDQAHGLGESELRYEAKWRPTPWLTLNGSLDARVDTHRQDERSLHLDWQNRTLARPSLSVHRLSAILTKDNWTVELGQQFVRWGTADFLNPTDRFAPKDFLNVLDQETLPILAARVTYAKNRNTFDVVWQPLFTPGRIPLFSQRWTLLPPGTNFVVENPVYPGRSSFGARWDYNASGYEYSLSYYDGFDYLPLFKQLAIAPAPALSLSFASLRLYGGDAAIPVKPFTLKMEVAYYTSPAQQEDEHALYLVQLERQIHELGVALAYAGDLVTSAGNTAQSSLERGFARSIIGHANYVIDPNRSLLLDLVVRQNGRGSVVRPKYTEAYGQHWRITVGYAWVRGSNDDFLGRYHLNSYAIAEARYSF